MTELCKHEMTGCVLCHPPTQPAAEMRTGKHRRHGIEASFEGWCDAGDRPIEEGDEITKDEENWSGYVHVDCL